MPRRTPQQRAFRVESLLKGRDLDSLPKYVLREVEFLAEDLGISVERFLSYKPSTRAKYIRAAKRGQSAADMRRRETSRRVVREEQKSHSITADSRWRQIVELRENILAQGMSAVKGPNTKTDKLDEYDLLSDDSLQQHIVHYGYAYVIRRLDQMLARIQRGGTARVKTGRQGMTRWRNQYGKSSARDFAAVTDYEDERWFWYHTGPTLYYGPVTSVEQMWKAIRE